MTRRLFRTARSLGGMPLLLVSTLALVPARGGSAQVPAGTPPPTVQTPTKPPSRAAVIAAAKEMMEAAGYCALITNGEDGYAQAREIDAFPPEDDLTVWIATKAATRKVGQIRKDRRVTLYYQVSGGAGYVTLFGTAAIVTDPAEKAKRWKEVWAPFYNSRNRGDDYTLIEVTPSRIEIVSLAHNMINDPKTWRPVSIELK